MAMPREPHLEVPFELVTQPCAHVSQDGIAARVFGRAASSKDVLAAATCSGSNRDQEPGASAIKTYH
jgi:hypothetical protein